MKHSFLHLGIWKKGRFLVKKIYQVTKTFPKEELFGLTSQMRRAVVSIPSNIAEGCGRDTNKQLSYFIEISIGSSCELETQVYLAFDLKYISELKMYELVKAITEQRKMMVSFRKTLRD